MAKKTPAIKKSATVSKKPVSKSAAISTPISSPVRNSAIPKVSKVSGVSSRAKAGAAIKTLDITTEMVALRAYEIHLSGQGGSELDNWFAAERELRGSV